MKTQRSFYFSARDLTVIGGLIVVSGVFEVFWSRIAFQILGPWTVLFTNVGYLTNVGFLIWGYLALFLIQKPGAATLVKSLGAVIVVWFGNPIGLYFVAYGALEGMSADLVYCFSVGNFPCICSSLVPCSLKRSAA